MSKKSKPKSQDNTIAVNRKARFDYTIEQTFEAGIALEGWEVKSLRDKKGQLTDSYVVMKKGEAFLLNAQIVPLISASTHKKAEPARTRKLLLHKKELNSLIGHVERKGYTIIPLKLYWSRNLVKISIGLAVGKKTHDKRASSKDRDWKRQQSRLLKNK